MANFLTQEQIDALPADARRFRDARLGVFNDQESAAQRFGLSPGAISRYETGTSRGWRKDAVRFARIFGVTVDWLLDGRGNKHPIVESQTIPVLGKVSAGQYDVNVLINDEAEAFDEIETFSPNEIMALIVDGDSMRPRFLNGETVLVRKAAILPERLLDCYAVCMLADGRCLLKIIRKGSRSGLFTLESLYHETIYDVHIIGAHAVIGVLTKQTPDQQLAFPKRK